MKLHIFEKVDGDIRNISYLLQRKNGNILFNPIDDEKFQKDKLKHLDSLGGIKWIFLTHGGDACPAAKILHEKYGATLYGHNVWDADKAKKRSKIPIGAKFSESHVFENEVEVISAPGHCPYFFAFLFKANRKKYLMTSDMIEGRAGGKWAVNVPERLSKVGLVSIKRIFDLDFDYLCPSFSHIDHKIPFELKKDQRIKMKEELLAILIKKRRIKDENVGR